MLWSCKPLPGWSRGRLVLPQALTLKSTFICLIITGSVGVPLEAVLHPVTSLYQFLVSHPFSSYCKALYLIIVTLCIFLADIILFLTPLLLHPSCTKRFSSPLSLSSTSLKNSYSCKCEELYYSPNSCYIHNNSVVLHARLWYSDSVLNLETVIESSMNQVWTETNRKSILRTMIIRTLIPVYIILRL